MVFVLISLSLAVSAVTSNIANRATGLGQPPAMLKTAINILSTKPIVAKDKRE